MIIRSKSVEKMDFFVEFEFIPVTDVIKFAIFYWYGEENVILIVNYTSIDSKLTSLILLKYLTLLKNEESG